MLNSYDIVRSLLGSYDQKCDKAREKQTAISKKRHDFIKYWLRINFSIIFLCNRLLTLLKC